MIRSDLLDRGTRGLDRTPTHTVVIVALTVIAMTAIVAALVGALDYDPAALLSSAAVCLAATTVAALLVGRLFRSTPHLPSTVISGLLLFLLLPPSTSATGLGTLALAGAIAGASRYLLAWRGRHLFNPAAIAAVLITLTQLTASTWWVATPVLLPAVVLTGAIVLIRVRRVRLALLFAVVALTITIARMVGFGLPPVDALWTAIGSFPTLFVAAFMLTEPQTLPPRRWQRLLLAVVVAVLASVPFQLGPIYSSPEFALVVGNLLAFGFGQRRGVRLTLETRTRVSPTAWEYIFTSAVPVRRSAGQYLELSLPHSRPDARGTRRVFTIVSPPGASVSIGTRVSEPMSSFKRALAELPLGATVRAAQVGGDFVLPRDAATPLLLVASGIGITPLLAQLPELAQRDAVLVYAAADADELAWAPRIGASGVRVITVTPKPPMAVPDAWSSVVGPLDAAHLAAAVPDLPARTAYLAGRPDTVRHLRRELRAVGVRRVRLDRFDGV